MSGATSVRRFRWATDSPMFKEVGGSGQEGQVRLESGQKKKKIERKEKTFRCEYIFHLLALLSVRPHESPSSGRGLKEKERKEKKSINRDLNRNNEFILV